MSEHKRIVVGLIHDGNNILMVKQAYGSRLWTLPGGRVEDGESLVQAVSREVREETGLIAEAVGLIGIRDKATQTVFVFAIKITGGKLVESVPGEIDAVRWFRRESYEAAKDEIEQFPASILERFFNGELITVPISKWDGYTGPADLFI